MAIPNLIIQSIVALGTLLAVIVAIWGDKIKYRFAGPKIEINLSDKEGYLTKRGSGERTIYYHLKIVNNRKWSPLIHARIMVVSLEKKNINDSYATEGLPIPLQLTWSFPQFHELLPTIASSDVCDLGYLDENSKKFSLSLYIYQNNFKGYIEAGQSMRVSIIVVADNYKSIDPLKLEISWDGEWNQNLEEMQKHLIISTIR